MASFPIKISVGVAFVAASLASFSIDSVNDRYGWLYLVAALGLAGLGMYISSQKEN
jgi:hypothetical protein